MPEESDILPGNSEEQHQSPKRDDQHQSSNMEVHHHSHTERKKWHHYFWEFFMLFLAVTLGFFVENQREHYVEGMREKQYIRSFSEDLKKDIQQLDSLIIKRNTREMQIDSIHFILTSPDPDLYGSQLYFYARYLPRPYVFINNDATIQQLNTWSLSPSISYLPVSANTSPFPVTSSVVILIPSLFPF